MGHCPPCALSCTELLILWCRVLNKADGSQVKVPLKHTFNEQQIEWFKAGSALNRMKQVRLVTVVAVCSWVWVCAFVLKFGQLNAA